MLYKGAPGTLMDTQDFPTPTSGINLPIEWVAQDTNTETDTLRVRETITPTANAGFSWEYDEL